MSDEADDGSLEPDVRDTPDPSDRVADVTNRFIHAVFELPQDEIRDLSLVLEDDHMTLTGKLKYYGIKE